MKKILTALLFLYSLNCLADATIQEKLLMVNAEWKNNPDGQNIAAEIIFPKNKTFNDWIATHLMLVEKTLRQRSVVNLSAEQLTNRMRLLDELHQYWQAGNFPVNDYLPYKNPVFIDRNGTHCAVGYLMKQSGNETLALNIDRDNKFVYVRNITTNGVAEWASANGFTIDELAWIQPGYPPNFIADDMSGGLNGPVHALAEDPVNHLIYAGGSFTASTRGAACNGIAVYYSGFAGWDWMGLDQGVNGTVNCLLFDNNRLYVGGDFTMAGTVAASNIAYYDFTTQQWNALGSLDSTVQALAIYNNELYAGGKFTGYLSKWTGSQWLDITQGFISGEGVRTLEQWQGLLVLGGNFELATGALRKNVACFDGTYMGAIGFGTPTPVNDFEVIGDTLYAGCDFTYNSDTCALAHFELMQWVVDLKPGDPSFFDGTSIKHLQAYNGALLCAGDFFITSILTYGYNLMAITSPAYQPQYYPLVIVNNPIRTMLLSENTLCIGGDFTATHVDSLNYIAQLQGFPSGIFQPNNSLRSTLTIFPNPATDRLFVTLNDDAKNKKATSYSILDLTGKELVTGKLNSSDNKFEIPVRSPDGFYSLQLKDANGTVLGNGRVIFQGTNGGR